jgi:hypothetical protein
MAACSSAPPSPSTDAEPTVVARWTADDGSIVALNVVLGHGTDRRRLPELARAIREQHPTARVIVTFFNDSAGEERFVIGHVPTDGGPITNARPSTAIATFDYPRPSPTTTAGAP